MALSRQRFELRHFVQTFHVLCVRHMMRMRIPSLHVQYSLHATYILQATNGESLLVE